MKQFVVLLLAALCLAACSKAEIDEFSEPVAIAGEPLSFSVIQQEARAAFFQGEGHGVVWEGDEAISIRAYPYGEPSSGAKQRGNYSVDKKGNCALLTEKSANGANPYQEITWSGSKMTLVAYYPATNNATVTNLWELPLADEQVQARANDHSHLTNYVIMQTEPQHFEEKPERVELRFVNLCSIIELTLKGPATHTIKEVSLVTTSTNDLSGTQGHLNATPSLYTANGALKDASLLKAYVDKNSLENYGSKQVRLTLGEPAALSTAEGLKLYLVTLPGQHAKNEITVQVVTTTGKVAEIPMGAINLCMNKVYRPLITLTEADFTKTLNEAAEIAIKGHDATTPYWGSVNLTEGATIITSRMQTNGRNATMTLSQIPERFTYSEATPWQTMAAHNSACPDVTIEALTDGKIFIATSGSSSTIVTAMKEDGWTQETPVKSESKTETIKYSNGTDEGYFTLWSKNYTRGEELKLSDLRTKLFGSNSVDFRGIRPVATSITWAPAKMTVESVTKGLLTTFKEGATLTSNSGATIHSTLDKAIPKGFVGMELYTVSGSTASTTVSARAESAGIAYAICPASLYPTYADHTASADVTGWKQIESFYGSDNQLYYILGKQVAVGDIITLAYGSAPLPVSSREELGTGILMGDLTVSEEAVVDEITVNGTLIDIRPFTAGSELYPQNEYQLLPSGVEELLGTGYSYATGLQEQRGPTQFTTKSAGTVYLATTNGQPSGWSSTGKTFTTTLLSGQVKVWETITYTIYQRACTAGETVSVASGGDYSPLLFGKELRVNAPATPGVTIVKSPDNLFRTKHVTNANIHVLPDGSYLALCTNTRFTHSTAIYRSVDKGATWALYSTPTKMNFTRLFEHNGALYIMGVESGGYDLVICKSTDNGKTWTTPDSTSGSGYIYLGNRDGIGGDGEKIKGHHAPTSMAIYDGRIWRAMEDHNDKDLIFPFVISAPVDADLLDPASWTRSNLVYFTEASRYTYGGHTILRLIEGNVVVGPDGKLYNLLRASCRTASKYACLARVEKVSGDYQLQVAQSDFIELPGGDKKFTIIYDEESGRYWTLTNPADEAGFDHAGKFYTSDGITFDMMRNRVALYSSADLRNWTLERDKIIYNADPFFHGYQYIDWKIDGDDIVLVSRTASPEERGLPIRQHDANMMTFHRIENFRN